MENTVQEADSSPGGRAGDGLQILPLNAGTD